MQLFYATQKNQIWYEKANIDSIIHQHFLECYPGDSKLVDFIMATEIGVFVFHFSQHFLIKLLVSSQSSVKPST